MRYCLVIVVLSVCLASVQAEAAPATRPSVPHPPGEMPPLAAAFEAQMVVRPGGPADKTRWYLVREPQRIETIRPSGRLAEIWERDARGELSLRRVFHADRRVVEYTAGELKARRLVPSWTALSTMLDPQTFAHVKRMGTRKVRHGTAAVYKGALHGDQIEIWWLDHLALPARFVRHGTTGRFTMTLQVLHTHVPQDWPRVTATALREYLSIDAADFGDMASDPFVRKVQQLDAERRREEHTGHRVPHAH